MESHFISLVLPVYNEAPSLEILHDKIREVMEQEGRSYEIIFVDDGSNDASFAVLRAIHDRDPAVRIIQLRRNFGKAAAYSAGFAAAQGDVLITLDTDLQDDPEEIRSFLKKIDEGFDLVVGWRHDRRDLLRRALPSKLFNVVVRSLTGTPLHDINCPFKAYRKEVLGEIPLYGELHRYIPVLARARGFSMTEIKIRNLPRRFGRSQYGLERYLRGMLDLLTVLFITRFAKRPMHLLALGGLVASGLGLGILTFLVAAHFLHVAGIVEGSQWLFHDRPVLSLGILLIIVGVQFVSSGLLAELLLVQTATGGGGSPYSVKTILERSDRRTAP